MDNKTPSKFVEIEIQPADLAVLAGACSLPLGALSPLPRPGTGSPQRGYRPAVFDAVGTLQEEVYELLPLLAAPEAAVGLAAVMPQGTLDLMIYHREQHSAALTRAEQKLWLQTPAPLPPLLARLEEGLVQAQGALPHHDLDLTIPAAFALWASLDVLRHADPAAPTARITIAALRQAMDLPLHGTENLAAYYRDCLLLPLPGEEELQQACMSLVEMEWIGRIGNDYLPGENLLALAQALGAIPWHVLARLGIVLPNQEAAGIQVRLMQSASGLGLGWYEFEDRVHLWTLDASGLMNLLQNILSDPGAFFPRRALAAAAAAAAAPAPAARPQSAAVPLQEPTPVEPAPRRRPRWLTCLLVGMGVTALVCILGVAAVFITGMLRSPEAQTASTQAATSPMPGATAPATDPAIPEPSQAELLAGLEILETRLVEAYPGNGYAVGLVRNNNDYTVSDISLDVVIETSSGEQITAETAYVYSTFLGPGESGAFQVYYYDPDEDPAANVTAEIAGASYEAQGKYNPSLELADETLFISDGGYVAISGHLTNTGTEAVTLSLSGVLHHGEELLGAAYVSGHASILGPGEQTAFRIEFGPLPPDLRPADEQYDYVMLVDARTTELPGSSPVKIAEAHNYYIDTYGGVHLVGQLVNEGDQPVVVSLNAALLDDAGLVLDASGLSIWPELIPPGAVIPYDINYWYSTTLNATWQEHVARYTIAIDPGFYEMPERTAVELALTDGEWQIEYDTLTFRGTVDVPTGSGYLYIIGSAVDAAGNPQAVASTSLDASAGSVPFECYVNLPEGFSPDGLEFVIQAFQVGE